MNRLTMYLFLGGIFITLVFLWSSIQNKKENMVLSPQVSETVSNQEIVKSNSTQGNLSTSEQVNSSGSKEDILNNDFSTKLYSSIALGNVKKEECDKLWNGYSNFRNNPDDALHKYDSKKKRCFIFAHWEYEEGSKYRSLQQVIQVPEYTSFDVHIEKVDGDYFIVDSKNAFSNESWSFSKDKGGELPPDEVLNFKVADFAKLIQ